MVTFADGDWKAEYGDICQGNSEGTDVLHYSIEGQHMAFNSYKHIILRTHFHENTGEGDKRYNLRPRHTW